MGLYTTKIQAGVSSNSYALFKAQDTFLWSFRTNVLGALNPAETLQNSQSRSQASQRSWSQHGVLNATVASERTAGRDTLWRVRELQVLVFRKIFELKVSNLRQAVSVHSEGLRESDTALNRSLVRRMNS